MTSHCCETQTQGLQPLVSLAACSTRLCPACFLLQFPCFLQVRCWKGQQLVMEDLTFDPFLCEGAGAFMTFSSADGVFYLLHLSF